MKTRHIYFKEEEIQAILDGRKSQTRRVVKKEIPIGNWEETIKHCPYGKPGDVLWVRETWAPLGDYPKCNYTFMYKVDMNESYSKWKPSILMSKDAARIWLQIEDVKIERLQDIREDDAIAEGVECNDVSTGDDYVDYYRDYNKPYDEAVFPWIEGKPIESFKSLWQSINGKDSWDSNSFVWVVKFKVLLLVNLKTYDNLHTPCHSLYSCNVRLNTSANADLGQVQRQMEAKNHGLLLPES